MQVDLQPFATPGNSCEFIARKTLGFSPCSFRRINPHGWEWIQDFRTMKMLHSQNVKAPRIETGGSYCTVTSGEDFMGGAAFEDLTVFKRVENVTSSWPNWHSGCAPTIIKKQMLITRGLLNHGDKPGFTRVGHGSPWFYLKIEPDYEGHTTRRRYLSSALDF